GWDLVLDARGAADLTTATAVLADRHRVVAGDIVDPRHRQALVDEAVALGGADALVNNASTLGHSPLPRLSALDPGTFETILDTNVVAPLALVQGFLSQLRTRHGRVLNVTSDAAVEAYPGWGGYGSSKAALEQLTRILAEEEPLLHVYAVDPGDMRTRMHQDAFPGEDISDRPEPSTVVPGLVRLLTDDLPNGRYQASALLPVSP
ncbi:MAG: SDR family oxidoreductase, partial [Nocardioidaceae bacterium]